MKKKQSTIHSDSRTSNVHHNVKKKSLYYISLLSGFGST